MLLSNATIAQCVKHTSIPRLKNASARKGFHRIGRDWQSGCLFFDIVFAHDPVIATARCNHMKKVHTLFKKWIKSLQEGTEQNSIPHRLQFQRTSQRSGLAQRSLPEGHSLLNVSARTCSGIITPACHCPGSPEIRQKKSLTSLRGPLLWPFSCEPTTRTLPSSVRFGGMAEAFISFSEAANSML